MSWLLLAIILITALYTDIRKMVIPNWVTVGGSLLGLGLNCAIHGWSGLFVSGVGLIAGFSVVLGLYAIGAVGAGDVKLFAAIGAITGTAFALTTLMYAVLVASVIGVVLLAIRKRLLTTVFDIGSSLFAFIRMRELSVISRWKGEEALRFPFMIAVAPGAMIAFAITLN